MKIIIKDTGSDNMTKATKIRYYIESLCVYDLKNDEIINAIYKLLSNLDSEKVLLRQS